MVEEFNLVEMQTGCQYQETCLTYQQRYLGEEIKLLQSHSHETKKLGKTYQDDRKKRM